MKGKRSRSTTSSGSSTTTPASVTPVASSQESLRSIGGSMQTVRGAPTASKTRRQSTAAASPEIKSPSTVRNHAVMAQLMLELTEAGVRDDLRSSVASAAIQAEAVMSRLVAQCRAREETSTTPR